MVGSACLKTYGMGMESKTWNLLVGGACLKVLKQRLYGSVF